MHHLQNQVAPTTGMLSLFPHEFRALACAYGRKGLAGESKRRWAKSQMLTGLTLGVLVVPDDVGSQRFCRGVS